jgi:hypothetical protein
MRIGCPTDRWQTTLIGDLNRLRELERRLGRGA